MGRYSSLTQVSPIRINIWKSVLKASVDSEGISHAYGGALSALSIEYTLEPVKNGGWKEQEVVKALYADEDDVLLASSTRDLDGDLW